MPSSVSRVFPCQLPAVVEVVCLNRRPLRQLATLCRAVVLVMGLRASSAELGNEKIACNGNY